ncbi:tyrosine-type recombinase/integrase [Micromonospora sp. NPDC047740]|uniref:tyrosine-type recombinase/integrase n=1 Tax=Micromonospora sp. NPDC047740 TaxID=3364254 RepID=UPI00371D7F33
MIRLHLDEYAGKDRLFVSRDGSPLRGDTLYQAFVRARAKVGLDDLTFHDLRHTGQTLAAQTGATLADLMKRLGHSSMAAARRYLHAVDGRDREIAKPCPSWPRMAMLHGYPGTSPCGVSCTGRCTTGCGGCPTCGNAGA